MSRLADKLVESLPSPGRTSEDAEDRRKDVLCGSSLEMAQLESALSCVARP
jgi:hypothetical protein